MTRGFGDHDLRAPNSNVLIKPFLSSQPEVKKYFYTFLLHNIYITFFKVRIVDIEKETIYDTDVLVMGTDGLWDVTSNERVAELVSRSLEQFPVEDAARYKYRFTSAAQDLVMSSRGKMGERSWRTSEEKAATIDDISVFVIPLSGYKEDYLRWKTEQETFNKPNPAAEEPVIPEAPATAPTPSGYVSFAQSEKEILPIENVENLQISDEEPRISSQEIDSGEIAIKATDAIPQQLPENLENVVQKESTSSA